MKTIRLLIADDHAILRRGLCRILEHYPEIEVVGEAGSGLQAIEKARETMPDVAVIDISMPDLSGIEATCRILAQCPRTAVLILSMHADERYVHRALKAGARGYLLKDAVEQELLTAIRAVHAGERFLSAAIARLLQTVSRETEAGQAGDRYELLTERERQVYLLLAEGRSNKDVAFLLGVSLHTVETHRTRIMEKLDVHSAAELVLSAVRRGLVF